MAAIDVIAFDADDTLWHNERYYVRAQAGFTELLSQYHSPEWINDRLFETEMRNLEHFGYGIKAFALSMIETAVELTEGRITGADIQKVVDIARQMITADILLLDHVAETIPQLAQGYPLMLITKGDLLDQETKIMRSGLEEYFRYIEIVSSKTRAVYERVFKRYSINPSSLLMVGNSIKSDILPILELGGSAVHIPYETTWQHEVADAPLADQLGFFSLEHLGQLPALLERLEK